MLVIANQTFHDAQEDVLRAMGERFECTDARGRQLLTLGLVATAQEQPKPKRAPRKRAAKKEA